VTTPPLLISPGRAEDRAEVAAMIRARAAWMREHGHGRWSSWDRDADALAAQLGDPDWPAVVVRHTCGRVAGITTLTSGTPHLAWTEQEQRESALFLQSTVTHPDYAGQGIGTVIAFWALDRAAGQDKQWVRRGVFTIGPDNRGLVRYYRTQGWRVVRTARHPRRRDVTVWSLQRRSAPQNHLADILQCNSAITGECSVQQGVT
jgi:GNAT superfamily N-acetyltransferase